MNNNNKIEIKVDCFAYNPFKKDCEGLNKLYCKKEKCNFYKRKKEVD